MFESYRNQSVNFLCNSADWFLYDATIVRLRVNDLLIAEGQYHKNCWQIFFHKSSKSVERPVNATCDENFQAVYQWLEKEAEVFTLGEIH